jgi:hypothetical protein
MTTVDIGLRLLEEKCRAYGFEGIQRQKLFDRQANYFVIRHRESKQDVDFVLSNEFLSDLQKTPGYLAALETYLGSLALRMQNSAWNAFYCISHRAVAIELQWPVDAIPQRAASFMWVDVRDLAQPALIARCSAILTHGLYLDLFKADPFMVPRLIVNSIREVVDRAELKFYSPDQHPRELQTIDVRAERVDSPVDSQGLEDFICGKVYWLGFRMSTGVQSARTWTLDPWDAFYLGTDQRGLAQAARLADAKGLIRITDDKGFAVPQDELLRIGRKFESETASKNPRVFVSAPPDARKFIEGVLREEFPELELIEAETGGKTDIRTLIENADLIVADVSGSANAAYEVGFAHALKKPVAILYDRKSGPVLFDVSTYFMLPYDLERRQDLRANLRNYVLSFLKA